MNNDTIASSLKLWGKQFLDSLLKAIIELLAVYLVNQFKKMKTKVRKHKLTIKRIIKIMGLFLSIGIMCLCLVSDQMIISSNDNVATIVVVETNHCSADEEEVFSCLPVQQCTENNSVNSVKICFDVWTAYRWQAVFSYPKRKTKRVTVHEKLKTETQPLCW